MTPPTDAQPGRPAASAGDGAVEVDRLADIESVLADLAGKQLMLSQYIDDQIADGIGIDKLTRLLTLHSQTASRLGRLLRDRRALVGEAADGMADAIAKALDELSNELGVKL